MHTRPVNTVQIFTASRPRWRFVEVGIIEVQQGPGAHTTYLLEDMREYAAEIGCDGIILTGSVNDLTWQESGIRGTCVMFAGR